jgi:hypothetical protein
MRGACVVLCGFISLAKPLLQECAGVIGLRLHVLGLVMPDLRRTAFLFDEPVSHGREHEPKSARSGYAKNALGFMLRYLQYVSEALPTLPTDMGSRADPPTLCRIPDIHTATSSS